MTALGIQPDGTCRAEMCQNCRAELSTLSGYVRIQPDSMCRASSNPTGTATDQTTGAIAPPTGETHSRRGPLRPEKRPRRLPGPRAPCGVLARATSPEGAQRLRTVALGGGLGAAMSPRHHRPTAGNGHLIHLQIQIQIIHSQAQTNARRSA